MVTYSFQTAIGYKLQTWHLGLIFIILGYILYTWFKPWIRAVILVSHLPGPPISPLFGNIFKSKEKIGILDMLSTAYVKYGPLVRSWIMCIPIVLVMEPKHLQLILGSSKLTDKNILYTVLDRFTGTGLATISGSKWKSHRKCIQPFFNINMIEACIPLFIECSQDLVEKLKNVKEIKITSYMHAYVMNVIYEILLGIPIDDNITKSTSPFIKGQNVALERFMKPWLMIDIIYKMSRIFKGNFQQQETVQEFVGKVLTRIKENKKQKKETKWCLLEFLSEISEEENDFNLKDAINETCHFMLGGQDTTLITLSFTLYYLAKHEEIQNKVVQELNGIFLKSSRIDMQTLNEMKYMEQCIKESMRLCPAIPLIARKLSEDVKLDECILPAGCNIFISPYATHRLPQYYPNPEEFNPERFSAESEERRHNFAYIPFSAGPRNCIAYKFAMVSMKTVIASLLRSYKICLKPGCEQLIPTYRISLKAKGSILLLLEPRGKDAVK